LRYSLDQFFSVALYPLRFTIRFFWVHKFILASLVRIRTLLIVILQDCTIICEDRLTALSPRLLISNSNNGIQGKNYAETQTWS
jgi:hypothetical protein